MSKFSLSFSAFECYDLCPFKFKKLYIDRVKTPNNEYAMFGTAFHNLLEYTYITQEFMMSSMVNAWKGIFDKESSKKDYEHIDLKRKKAQYNRGLKDIKVWFNLASQEGILRPCMEHEMLIEGKFKVHKLKAKIDLVMNIKGGVGLIDWKTGKPARKNLMQLVLYAILYEKKVGVKIDWIVLYYTKTNKVVYQKLDKDILKEAGKYFGELYNKIIRDTEFQAKDNDMCYFCEFQKNGECPLSRNNNSKKFHEIII